jgi:hypothetical protein
LTNNVNHHTKIIENGEKLVIPIIPFIPPSQKGQKPNLVALLASSFLLIFLALGLVGFTLLNGMSISMIFAILGIIIVIASLIPMIVLLESKQSNSGTETPVRYVSRRPQPSEPTWTDHSKSRYEYCIDCGSLVDPTDFFCATCGLRLK